MRKYYLEVFNIYFSLKTIIYAILSSAMLCVNHGVLGGKNIDFRRWGGVINIQNIDS